MKISLTQGKVAYVSHEDADLAELNWHAVRCRRKWYAGRRYGGSKEYMHRVVLARALGRPLLRGEQVDHIDGDGLDNRRGGLRLATSAENNRNRWPVSGASQYRGVSWHKKSSKWRAQGRIPNLRVGGTGRRAGLGYFDDEIEAALAYDRFVIEHYGEFARPNFPQPQEELIAA
jgi:hypothetical protein